MTSHRFHHVCDGLRCNDFANDRLFCILLLHTKRSDCQTTPLADSSWFSLWFFIIVDADFSPSAASCASPYSGVKILWGNALTKGFLFLLRVPLFAHRWWFNLYRYLRLKAFSFYCSSPSQPRPQRDFAPPLVLRLFAVLSGVNAVFVVSVGCCPLVNGLEDRVA